MLLLLLCLLPAVSSANSSAVLFKPIDRACPDTGYFFEPAENVLEPALCYLCFCQGEEHAICSLRKSCDEQLYIHQKREIKRIRRANSGGFGDIFFRDATREIFNKNLVNREECKPHTSKSIGCPPADWCTGCMVCDCDANGHWDCHLMSFCDKNSKGKHVKKTNKPHSKKASNAGRVKSTSKNSSKNTGINTNNKAAEQKMLNKSANDLNKIPQISVATKKSFLRKGEKNKTLVIKKYISTSSPIKSPDLLKHKNNKKKLAQMLYRQYMSSKNQVSNKITKRTITDKNTKDHILNKKFKKNIKQTKMKVKKSMNTKVHKNNSKVMKNKQGKEKEKAKKQIKKASNFKGEKYKGKLNKRSKRQVLLVSEPSVNVTKLEGNETANVSNGEQFSNVTEISITISENFKTNLRNYAYTIDNYVTAIMDNNNQSLHNVTGDVTTERHIDIITVVDKNSTTKNGADIHPTATQMATVVNTTDHDLRIVTVYNDVLTKIPFMKDNNFKLNIQVENTTNYINYSQNLIQGAKQKVSVQDIKKMNFGKKKFHLKKLVKTLNSNIKSINEKHYFANKPLVDTKSTHIKINGTLNNIQNLLEIMLHGVDKDKKSKEILKTKSYTAIKYLKRLLSRSKNKTSVEKVAVIDSICENFGPCNLNTKKVINFKVKQLISEATKTFRSIKIIKGILQLLQYHKVESANSTFKETDLRNHLKNLDAILKGKFAPEAKLTPTQVIQINYIKSNTRVFIKSIGKFANILKDIISIIKSQNEYKMLKDNATIKSKYRNKIHREESLYKMKRLLLRYNLLQNTFLRKMYETLANVEEKVKTEREHKYKESPVNKTPYKIAIEKYVENINDNLNKLKDLVASMDSKTRRKRDTTDDNAVGYLLSLMEYLLKRNNLLDTPPVNDGIDLLIETIRRAPDIKSIHKPVLQYVPVKISDPISSAASREDNDSKSKIENSKEGNKINANDKSEEESINNDIFQKNERILKKKTIQPTTEEIQNIIDLSDVITEYPSKVYMASFNTYENTEKSFNDITTATGTLVRRNEDSEIIIMDDDNATIAEKTEIDLETSTTRIQAIAENRIEEPKIRKFIPMSTDKSIPVTTIKEPKTKLDLINEAYEKEIMEETEQSTVKATLRVRARGEAGKRDPKTASSDISSTTTKEIIKQEKQKLTDSEKIEYRKQMDLLNSLDYGTDRSLVEDSVSKDNSPLDRLTNEAFSIY